MAIKFDLFKKQHVKFPRGQTKSWDVGILSENKSKNRYGNLAAYDETRVKLNFQTGLGQSDYINANYVDGYKMKKTYIATQGPKSNTLVDFWRMIWQEQVSLIVMVTNLIENGKTKCEKYWPEERQSVCVKGLQIQSVKEEIYPDYTQRTMRLMNGDQNRLVVQMHYTQWPDHGVPFYAKSLACFMEKILEIKSDSPVVVHCSAGVGRTGTVILIDACLRMARAEGFFNAFDMLGKIRAQRANLVDNEANGKNLLNQHWLGINRICTMDWQHLQAQSVVLPERFGLHDYPAASDKYLKLFPSQPTERNLRLINAVFVDGFKKKNKFICTHTPTQSTV
ncbi:receptor-type tyrosine-protein phosphatase T-like [Neocloeon triangulifer]|uniref:receptor-type tyrosine-protein phosphatase T-like n=1 Tax=Neocloeon triangulifer TaxID=2078957 RepID=UPI00286ED9A3|nr:receptor-type tyrosine-protein phosphatase T-like [Neocloeon triangulifer]